MWANGVDPGKVLVQPCIQLIQFIMGECNVVSDAERVERVISPSIPCHKGTICVELQTTNNNIHGQESTTNKKERQPNQGLPFCVPSNPYSKCCRSLGDLKRWAMARLSCGVTHNSLNNQGNKDSPGLHNYKWPHHARLPINLRKPQVPLSIPDGTWTHILLIESEVR